MREKIEPLTIVIGRDMDSDISEFFSGKPLSEVNKSKKMLYLDSFEELVELLSPKKLDLLRSLMNYHPNPCTESVSEIAEKLGRKQEAISRDLNCLKKLGLVKTVKNKQKIQASVPFKRIEIRIE